MFNLFQLIFLLFLSCNGTKISQYIVKYTHPYFAVNLIDKALVHKNPGENKTIVYFLEKYRIVKVFASVSLKKSFPIWYYLKESDFEGYSLEKYFQIFSSLKEAKNFVLDKKIFYVNLLKLYKKAEKEFIDGKFFEAIIILNKILNNYKIKFKDDYFNLYYHIKILIGRIYSISGNVKKAINYFKSFNKNIPIIFFGRFNEKKILFEYSEVEKSLKKNSYSQYQGLLSWPVQIYLAKLYELQSKFEKAKKLYFNILIKYPKKKDNKKRIFYDKTIYFNTALDYLIQLEKREKRIKLLEWIKNKVDISSVGRYLLFKLGLLYENTLKQNLLKHRIKNNIKKALFYYKKFIDLFEKEHHKNPYFEEIQHYFDAKNLKKQLKNDLIRYKIN